MWTPQLILQVCELLFLAGIVLLLEAILHEIKKKKDDEI